MTPRVQLAAALIRVFEGCKLQAYWDKYGKIWTIGYGHTRGITEGMSISLETAEQFLMEDIDSVIKLTDKVKSDVQAAVLISFGHNCGAGALARVIRGEIVPAPEGFITPDGLRYGVHARGQYLDGLDARRKLEARLYLAGGLNG